MTELNGRCKLSSPLVARSSLAALHTLIYADYGSEEWYDPGQGKGLSLDFMPVSR